MLSVVTNTQSLNAQRNLSITSSSLSKSLERLSSGLRINRASDDAAGLAIANGLGSQVRGLNQAVRNANDGVSLINTAESALETTTNLLQRMRELAVQSANDLNSADNRATIQNEITQLQEEITRIGNTVQFNGLNMLDGTFSSKSLQIGAQSSQNISFDLDDMRATALGENYSVTSTAPTAAATAGQLQINDVDIVTSSDGVSAANDSFSALAYVQAINASGAGVTATANALQVAGNGNVTANDFAANDVKINGIDIGAVTGMTADQLGAQKVADAVNAIKDVTGVNATVTGAKVYLNATDGRNITVTTTAAGETATALNGAASTVTNEGTYTITDTEAFKVDGSAVANGGMTAGIKNTASGQTIDTISVASVAGANSAIDAIDNALSQVADARSKMGAITNRLDATISNLRTVAENLSASESRIRDADFASETASLTKAQILQQAGTAILAQANMIPQAALSLLG